MMAYFSRFEKLTYESQMVVLICFLASIRVVFAVAIDLGRDVIRPVELATDFLILFMFVSFTYIGYAKSKIENIHFLFGILFTVLAAVNFIQFGGVQGYTKFNYYGILYVLIMMYSGTRLYFIVAFHLLILAGLLYLQYVDFTFFKDLYIGSTDVTTDFWFTLLTLSLFTYYLKDITNAANEKYSALGSELNARVRESKIVNKKLVEQAERLTQMQLNLEAEIQKRTKELQTKNESIEEFIHFNSVKLQAPLSQLISKAENLDGTSSYQTMLKVACNELQLVSGAIQATLMENKPLKRDHIISKNDK